MEQKDVSQKFFWGTSFFCNLFSFKDSNRCKIKFKLVWMECKGVDYDVEMLTDIWYNNEI